VHEPRHLELPIVGRDVGEDGGALQPVREQVDVLGVGLTGAGLERREQRVDVSDRRDRHVAGRNVPRTTCPSPTSRTHVEPFGNRSSLGAASSPASRRTCWPAKWCSRSPITSPCVQSAVGLSETLSSRRRASLSGAPSVRPSASWTSSPRSPASGASVSRQRTYGLLTVRPIGSSCSSFASSSPWPRPAFEGGRSSSSPSQALRLPALAWRTR